MQRHNILVLKRILIFVLAALLMYVPPENIAAAAQASSQPSELRTAGGERHREPGPRGGQAPEEAPEEDQPRGPDIWEDGPQIEDQDPQDDETGRDAAGESHGDNDR